MYSWAWDFITPIPIHLYKHFFETMVTMPPFEQSFHVVPTLLGRSDFVGASAIACHFDDSLSGVSFRLFNFLEFFHYLLTTLSHGALEATRLAQGCTTILQPPQWPIWAQVTYITP